jgi:hypothetical protein
MVRSALHTFFWNAVPATSSVKANARRRPAKYSFSWRSVSTSTGCR